MPNYDKVPANSKHFNGPLYQRLLDDLHLGGNLLAAAIDCSLTTPRATLMINRCDLLTVLLALRLSSPTPVPLSLQMAVQKAHSGGVALKVRAAIARATEKWSVLTQSRSKTGPTSPQKASPVALENQSNAKTTAQRARAKPTHRSKTLNQSPHRFVDPQRPS